MADFTKIRHFTAGEFPNPEIMDQNLIERLDQAREEAGVPFSIASSWRESSTTSHGRGTGVDIRATNSYMRHKIVFALITVGFRRIGIYDKHIHADLDEPNASPSPRMWWAVSQ